MEFERSIDAIVEALENAKHYDRGCSLLVGAGCSVKAGIPLARDFVKEIEKDYPAAYSSAPQKTYPYCMAELNPIQRRDLIARHVKDCKLNWAHVALASLMKEGYVDRVLTTNFDPLVLRACALLGEFPAVYDVAASALFHPAEIPGKAVFYLYGQWTGFLLINTRAEYKKNSRRLKPVFEEAGRGRLWIVVGYSGESDPVFGNLAKVKQFLNGLYWVGYLDSEPAPHVREGLLVGGKYAYFTSGYDADSFFVTLGQKLRRFPPSLVSQPFSHLLGNFEMLTPFIPPGQEAGEDVTSTPRKWIGRAIKEIEGPGQLFANAQRLLMAGEYDQVVAFRVKYDKVASTELGEPLSWAYVMQGNALLHQARTKTGEDADRLFELAGKKYQAALAIKPDMHEALYNWGNALSDQAKTRGGKEADRMLALAKEKFSLAEEIKRGSY